MKLFITKKDPRDESHTMLQVIAEGYMLPKGEKHEQKIIL